MVNLTDRLFGLGLMSLGSISTAASSLPFYFIADNMKKFSGCETGLDYYAINSFDGLVGTVLLTLGAAGLIYGYRLLNPSTQSTENRPIPILPQQSQVRK
jgi:hypothetical protein